MLAYALASFFLSALLIKVEATSDDESDQEVFAALLIVCLLAGPCTIVVTVCAGALLPRKKEVERVIEKQCASTKPQRTGSSPPLPAASPFDNDRRIEALEKGAAQPAEVEARRPRIL